MPSFAAKIFIARCARSANLRPVGHFSIHKYSINLSVTTAELGACQELIKDHLTRRT
ncbi:unnamed protein product [Acanthoscelides obtectus]|uniref:Uncharacterized protein n=1 Tax=Acanthoscelides obtectus TaxID=200917 RepID=A0A9P0NZ95_ACAOB|nr:unnamed protein product [Acanthoscelides obtectus]CAK1621837.1 hypothetical protein AOBTE_LOCUS1161 [Acanthoscelides obtectus]